MKKLNILGIATLIAANATSQEVIKTQPVLDKKDEVTSIAKSKNENESVKNTQNTKKTKNKKNTSEKISHKK